MSIFDLGVCRFAVKALAVCAGLAAILMWSGCWVTSVNPLYEDASVRDPDIVFEKGLTGTWTITVEKCLTNIAIVGSDEGYVFNAEVGQQCDEPVKKTQVQGQLVKLGSSYFLDISPLRDQVCDMCIPLHRIFLVKFDSNTLSLTPIESQGLKKLQQAKTVDLSILPEDPRPHIFEQPTTLTALPKDLKAFCRRFAGDKEVFQPDSAVVLKRPSR